MNYAYEDWTFEHLLEEIISRTGGNGYPPDFLESELRFAAMQEAKGKTSTELLDTAAAILSKEYPEDSMMSYEFEMKVRKLIEPIIAAARAEGKEEEKTEHIGSMKVK